MKSQYSETFGVAIAFVAPGVLVIWGIAQYSPTVEEWFGIAAESEVSVGGFLFVLLASLATGVFVSGLRWALIDRLMNWSGVIRPALNEASWQEPEKLAAFGRANEDFYRYYQFYSNMIISIIGAYAMWLNSRGLWPWNKPGVSGVGAGALVVLFLSARNSLENYYRAAERILGTTDD